MKYDFQKQLRAGESGEAILDRFFSQWYSIRKASRDEQRQGIDRLFTSLEYDWILKVEYKTDWAAHRTGNAFVEIVSVDTEQKPGWAYSSRADLLAYFVIDDDLCYLIDFARLRAQLPRWQRMYRTRQIPNQGYNTIGLLVPLDEFESLAEPAMVVSK